ncbi:extracellular solute-binding protein [Oceanobacillus sp. FSL W8-0428]|uniref:Putative 2-aminoethylphosphonate ABC transporter substrate-binding protein n=1 Tax=Oceanobacillus sojae TaxID=582851 RepID=A0A511ZLT9_9BACI|nr:extracellular solute-binding protein [Oceanobacillus sojae]GEN88415.1 putative 2-aminoethylphosphonate ABC transporter substrate-binding protein [Oceanobacillus sojae]
MLKSMKKSIIGAGIGLAFVLAGCGTQSSDDVVIYTNADEEATSAMEAALDDAGYEGEYILQSQGTSELGGKLLAEGDKIEADVVTMSSYFLDSAQEQNDMFEDLTYETSALEEHPPYYTPILGNTGAIFVNTEVLKQHGLATPESIADLAKPEYEGLVSIPNIDDSSTAWLMVQAVISEYGEEEGKEIFQKLIANVGPHLESSGSGPISKVQAGEAAAGFGLRHQAVVAKESGAPIAFVDPTEGNFSLMEAVAVVKKDNDEKTQKAMDMAEVISTDAREELLTYYPVALYEGETVDEAHKPAHSKTFEQPLDVELLEQHQEFFHSAK